MVTLPVDVLCLIFSQLLQNDQLECMTVCRQWHDTILHHTLFRVVRIDCQEQLNTLIKTVKKDPLIGAKVDSLKIYLNLENTFDDRIFIELFPNLRELKVLGYGDFNTSMEPFKQHETQGWRERMEKIKEYKCDRNAYKLLQSGVCERLTAISVCRFDIEPGQDFIRALTNAPALKNLTMEHYLINLQHLELLHSVMPSLTSLSLEYVSFDGSDFPNDIKPATLLRSFQNHSMEFEDIHETNIFAQYICQKYTQLEEIKMDTLGMGLDREDMIETATQNRSIITSHLKTLAPKLKTLKMHIYMMGFKFIDRFYFNILDDCGCRIKRLELLSSLEASILEQLSMTTQVQYIQSLTVKEIVYNNDRCISLNWLGRFTKLKELEIRFPLGFRRTNKYQVSLIELFGYLENNLLENLKLHDVVVDFSNVIIAPVYPSLKALTFVKADLKHNMDLFISHSFPNLKQLTLDHSSWEGETLMLPNLDLSCLELITSNSEKVYYVLVITLGDNKQRLYTVAGKESGSKPYIPGTGKDDSTYHYIPSKLYDASEEIPTLTIVCRLLHNFSMLNQQNCSDFIFVL